jgi:hypothetical protein
MVSEEMHFPLFCLEYPFIYSVGRLWWLDEMGFSNIGFVVI